MSAGDLLKCRKSVFSTAYHEVEGWTFLPEKTKGDGVFPFFGETRGKETPAHIAAIYFFLGH